MKKKTYYKQQFYSHCLLFLGEVSWREWLALCDFLIHFLSIDFHKKKKKTKKSSNDSEKKVKR